MNAAHLLEVTDSHDTFRPPTFKPAVTPADAGPNKRDLIAGLEKGLAVIEAFEHFGIEDFSSGDTIEWQRAQTA